jgi:hypothetical protein
MQASYDGTLFDRIGRGPNDDWFVFGGPLCVEQIAAALHQKGNGSQEPSRGASKTKLGIRAGWHFPVDRLQGLADRTVTQRNPMAALGRGPRERAQRR